MQLIRVTQFPYHRALTIQSNGYSIWLGVGGVFIPLFLQFLMAREQIPSILRFERQIQSLHWLPVVWISGEFHLSGYLLHHNSCWIFFRQQMKNSVYRSRQSLNSPSPGETEMDLLVTRERPRRGIRNSGYDVSVWWAEVNASFAFSWMQRG